MTEPNQKSNTVLNTIIGAVIVFIINFFLAAIISYLSNVEKGVIITTESIKIDSLYFSQSMIISNYDNKTLKDLDFFAKNCSIFSVKSDDAIEIKINSTNKFTIQNIYPKSKISVNVILIKNKSSNGLPNILPLNYADLSLKYIKGSEIDLKNNIQWLSICLTAFIMALLFIIFIHYIDKIVNKFRNQANKIEEEIKIIKKVSDDKFEKSNFIIKKMETSWSRVKLLLLTRNRDLREENDFYRELLKELIEKQSDEKINTEKISNIITEKLKTYTTKGNPETSLTNYDVIAGMLKDVPKDSS